MGAVFTLGNFPVKSFWIGVRDAGRGVREGVLLSRHEYVWGMDAGEKRISDFGFGNSGRWRC